MNKEELKAAFEAGSAYVQKSHFGNEQPDFETWYAQKYTQEIEHVKQFNPEELSKAIHKGKLDNIFYSSITMSKLNAIIAVKKEYNVRQEDAYKILSYLVKIELLTYWDGCYTFPL